MTRGMKILEHDTRDGVSDITPEDYLIDNCSQRAVNFILSTAHRHHQWAGIRGMSK